MSTSTKNKKKRQVRIHATVNVILSFHSVVLEGTSTTNMYHKYVPKGVQVPVLRHAQGVFAAVVGMDLGHGLVAQCVDHGQGV